MTLCYDWERLPSEIQSVTRLSTSSPNTCCVFTAQYLYICGGTWKFTQLRLYGCHNARTNLFRSDSLSGVPKRASFVELSCPLDWMVERGGGGGRPSCSNVCLRFFVFGKLPAVGACVFRTQKISQVSTNKFQLKNILLCSKAARSYEIMNKFRECWNILERNRRASFC